jgi:preprotein translocase subunit SecY
MITKSILRDKLLYSMLILIMYVFGQNVPIPWVVTQENALGGGGIQQYFRELMAGRQTVVSVFSLGLMPWMTASIVWQIFQSITRDNKSKTSSRKNYQKSMVLALLVAVLQGTVYTSSLQFSVLTHDYDALLRVMTVITMIAGSSIVIVLASSNKLITRGLSHRRNFLENLILLL